MEAVNKAIKMDARATKMEAKVGAKPEALVTRVDNEVQSVDVNAQKVREKPSGEEDAALRSDNPLDHDFGGVGQVGISLAPNHQREAKDVNPGFTVTRKEPIAHYQGRKDKSRCEEWRPPDPESGKEGLTVQQRRLTYCRSVLPPQREKNPRRKPMTRCIKCKEKPKVQVL